MVLWCRTPKGFLMKHGLLFWVLAWLNYYYSFPYFIEICTHSCIKGSLVCRFLVVWNCPQSTSVVVNAECKVRSSETHWNQGLIANLTGLLLFVFWIEVWGTIGIALVCCILWIICSLATPWNQYHWTCDDSTIAILPELVIPWVFWRRILLRLCCPKPAHCWRQASQLLGCCVCWCDLSHLCALRLPWLCVSMCCSRHLLPASSDLFNSYQHCSHQWPQPWHLRQHCQEVQHLVWYIPSKV